MKVKICGITNLEDAQFASQEGADAIGFIFSKKSPRFITVKEAKKIISCLDPFVTKTGVFADEDKEKVLETADCLGLSVLQFHGKETASYCNSFTKKYKVIKTFFPQDMPFSVKISPYRIDGFLFDVKLQDKLKGKKILPMDALKEIGGIIGKGKRVILSGGLNPDNISTVKNLNPYAVDVASGVENLVGKKDHGLVKLFIKRAKG
ncbi:MAG: phosphoribosylanthranilate isomerase [Candidatus Omnitrophota bacterium]